MNLPLVAIDACVAVGTYLLGSIPTGYLVGRRYGVDIRQHGSGNIGATNVMRVLGRKPGIFVFACDLLKGLTAVRLGITVARHVVNGTLAMNGSAAVVAGIIAALACILGHNFPVWLGWRGGKGVATTVGVLLGLMPGACVASAIAWAVTFYISRYVSLASLAGAAVLPLAVLYLKVLRPHGATAGGWPLFIFSLVAAGLIFWRHRSNISRLIAGTESRFAPKRKAPPPAAV